MTAGADALPDLLGENAQLPRTQTEGFELLPDEMLQQVISFLPVCVVPFLQAVCQVRFNINSWFFLEAFVPRLNIVLSNEIHPIGPRCTAGFPVEYQTSSYKGLLL